MKNLLYELLALLPIADEWNMPNLKAQVEFHIIYRQDLVQRLLPLHEESEWIHLRENQRRLNGEVELVSAQSRGKISSRRLEEGPK
jgi:hypothetical protein